MAQVCQPSIAIRGGQSKNLLVDDAQKSSVAAARSVSAWAAGPKMATATAPLATPPSSAFFVCICVPFLPKLAWAVVN